MPGKNKKPDSPRNKKDWLIIIVSYKRTETLLAKTLNYLQQTDVPLDRIRIFVGNATEYAEYSKALGKDWVDRIIIGKVGIGAVKNFAAKYYPEGQYLFFMDDDVECLFRGTDHLRKNFKRVFDLSKVIDNGFAEAERMGTGFWGVYNVPNPFYMCHHLPITYDLKYCVGRAYGVINDHGPSQEITVDLLEDYERTIKMYLRDGKMVRFNRITISEYYVGPGGVAEWRNKKTSIAAMLKLQEMYPDLFHLPRGKLMVRKSQNRGLDQVRLTLRDDRVLANKRKKISIKPVLKKQAEAITSHKTKGGIQKKKKKRNEGVAKKVAKDWGVSSMVLRKRKPHQV